MNCKLSTSESLILNEIIKRGEISRIELASITKLDKSSISLITKKLIQDELIIETRTGNSTTLGGRKPISLEFNKKCALSISIEVGLNYIEALLSYVGGEECSFILKNNIDISPETISKNIISIINEFEKVKPITKHGIIGVCIAFHSIVVNNEIIFKSNYKLHNFDLYNHLSTLINYPLTFENEANLSALGEYVFSSTSDNIITVSIHTGIGAGIVKDGTLLRGTNGIAGEIGHQIIVIDGKKCSCGNNGCIEQYASNKVTFEKFAKLKKLDFVDQIILAKYFKENDQDAKLTIYDHIKYLSIGINNLIVHHNPDVIILNSSLFKELPELIDIVKNQLGSYFAKDITILNSTLNERSTLLGGLVLNLQNFLNISHIKFY